MFIVEYRFNPMTRCSCCSRHRHDIGIVTYRTTTTYLDDVGIASYRRGAIPILWLFIRRRIMRRFLIKKTGDCGSPPTPKQKVSHCQIVRRTKATRFQGKLQCHCVDETPRPWPVSKVFYGSVFFGPTSFHQGRQLFKVVCPDVQQLFWLSR